MKTKLDIIQNKHLIDLYHFTKHQKKSINHSFKTYQKLLRLIPRIPISKAPQ